MKYEVFEQILNDIEELNASQQKIYEAGIDIINVLDPHYSAVNHLFSAYYGKSGGDWIDWFMHEKKDNEEAQAWDKDNNPICRNKKELWELVERERTDDYVLPRKLTSEESLEMIKAMAGNLYNEI